MGTQLINLSSSIINFISSLAITIVGFLLVYFFTKKPKLKFYYGAIAEVPLQIPKSAEQDDQTPHTHTRIHTLVILNQGGVSAHNVRIGHNILPVMHSVSPAINISNPENSNEILIPVLCPREVCTITYVYPRSLHVSAINSYLRCDEGLGEIATLQNVRIKSPWVLWILRIVFFIGVFSMVDYVLKILPILNHLSLL